MLQKAWSTSMRPTKTAFPREGPWLSPGTPMKSMPCGIMVKGACPVSMTFGWASMTWSLKASLSMSMELPSPSSTGTVHSLMAASGKTVPCSPSQLRANGVTRSVVAARDTYASLSSLNRPFSNASSKKDQSWLTGWWFPRVSQIVFRNTGVRQFCYPIYLWFCPSQGMEDHKIMIQLCAYT